jgi:hypothetical protein
VATISSAANPASFGFETGVIPTEYTYSKPQISANAKVVDVSTLPAPFNTGTTSPRAWRQNLVNYDSYAGLTIPLKLNAGSTVSLKLACSISTYDSISITLFNTTSGSGTQLTVVSGETSWFSASYAPGIAGNYTLQVDVLKSTTDQTQGKLAAVFVTDIAVSSSGYLRQAATTGTASLAVGPFSLASRISLLGTRLANEVASIRSALGLKAPIDSPVLTGYPAAPTQPVGDSSSLIANTQFVSTQDLMRLLYRGAWTASTAYTVNDVVTNANISYVCKTSHTSGTSFSATNWTVFGYGANAATLASPTFTGDPKAPTPAAGDNDTSIATTAFVQTAVGTRMLFRSNWATSTVYALNDVVRYGAQLWICTTAHTSSTTFATANWGALAYYDLSAYAPLSATADLQVGARLGAVGKDISSTDLNALYGTGFYVGATLTNSPDGSNDYFHVQVFTYAQGNAQWETQVAHRFGANTPGVSSWVRSNNSGTWGAWRKYAETDSPTFTGDPQAPTPAAKDNDTSIATTAFVQGAVAQLSTGDLIPNRTLSYGGANWSGTGFTFVSEPGGINRAVVTVGSSEKDLFAGGSAQATFPVKKGGSYFFSVEIGLDATNTITPTGTGSAGLYVNWKDASGTNVGASGISIPYVNMTTTRVTQTLVATAPATAVSVQAYLFAQAGTPVGSIIALANPSMRERLPSLGLVDSIALPGTPTVGTDAADGDSSKAVASTGWISRLVGTPVDWATQFTNALTAPVGAQAASKTVPGISRFATDSEAAAGQVDLVSMSPKQVLSLVRSNPLRYATLAALYADTTRPEGTTAVVDRYAFSTGIIHRESVWQMSNAQWLPVGLHISIEASDQPGALAASNSITSSMPTTVFVPPGTRTVALNQGITHIWNGSAWIWQPMATVPTATSVTSSVGTGDIQLLSGFSQMAFCVVHFIAPNFDRQQLLWIARNPYNPGGSVTVISTTQVNNSPGYAAANYSIQNYGLYANISNAGNPSPISCRATLLNLGDG